MKTLLDEILTEQDGSPCTTPCPSPAPPKGQFSGPDSKGHRWFVPEYRQYPNNLWDLAKVIRVRMLADRRGRGVSVPTEAEIRYGIRIHECNQHFTASKPMFMPRFGSDGCTGTGNHYGSIYIPFKFDGKSRPDPTRPRPPRPKPPRPKSKDPKKHRPGKGKAGGEIRIQAPTLQGCSDDIKDDVLLQWEIARLLALNMLDRFKRLKAMSKQERIKAWCEGHELTYFGRYSYVHFRVVWRRIKMTNNALLGTRLTIACDRASSSRGCRSRKVVLAAYARPVKKTMVLCKPWFESDLSDKPRMIIHEAAHLACLAVGTPARDRASRSASRREW